ncbi:MAG: PDZ domain-containing protein [Chitinophagaceae bacterium]
MNKPSKNFTMALITGLIAGIAGLQATAQKHHSQLNSSNSGKYEEIIIRKDGNLPQKMDIKIDGSRITLNGKPLSDSINGDFSVLRKSLSSSLNPSLNFPHHLMTPGEIMQWDAPGLASLSGHPNQALLGVYTLKSAQEGVLVKKVATGSAAQKAGLQEGDLITQIDQTSIGSPQDLIKAIGTHQPGDLVHITYWRNKQPYHTTAELKKNREALSYLQEQNLFTPDWNFPGAFPKEGLQGGFPTDQPRIGMSIRDNNSGNGATVMGVLPNSPALAAGLKKEDVIQEVGGQQVTNADAVAQAIHHLSRQPSFSIKILRQGQARTLWIKIPKKLNTLNL